jgi:ribose 5-phosphate isomerase B
MSRKLTERPIAIAADHRGVGLKARLKIWLAATGHAVADLGTHASAERVDAMDYAVALAAEIQAGRSDFAVGICGSGQMMAITANRFPFIRATLLHTPEESLSARQHGDANMLVLGADLTDPDTAERILAIFLHTAAEGDRYAERRERLAKLDICALQTL